MRILTNPVADEASSSGIPSTMPHFVAFIPTPGSDELVIKSPCLIVPFSELYFTYVTPSETKGLDAYIALFLELFFSGKYHTHHVFIVCFICHPVICL